MSISIERFDSTFFFFLSLTPTQLRTGCLAASRVGRDERVCLVIERRPRRGLKVLPHWHRWNSFLRAWLTDAGVTQSNGRVATCSTNPPSWLRNLFGGSAPFFWIWILRWAEDTHFVLFLGKKNQVKSKTTTSKSTSTFSVWFVFLPVAISPLLLFLITADVIIQTELKMKLFCQCDTSEEASGCLRFALWLFFVFFPLDVYADFDLRGTRWRHVVFRVWFLLTFVTIFFFFFKSLFPQIAPNTHLLRKVSTDMTYTF